MSHDGTTIVHPVLVSKKTSVRQSPISDDWCFGSSDVSHKTLEIFLFGVIYSQKVSDAAFRETFRLDYFSIICQNLIAKTGIQAVDLSGSRG